MIQLLSKNKTFEPYAFLSFAKEGVRLIYAGGVSISCRCWLALSDNIWLFRSLGCRLQSCELQL